jgi:PAS domain S-box-containing protein
MGKQIENKLHKLEKALKQAQKALEQSEKQFHGIIKHIPGIVYLCSCDKHWTMQYIIKEVEKISGYPASDFINNNVRSYASIIHPDDVIPVEKAVNEAASNNRPYELEYRIIRKDGKIVWVYEKGQQFFDEDNHAWLSGIIFDITEQKQNALALDIASEEWQITFDTMSDAVFLLNRNCYVMKCNRAAHKMFHKKGKDIIGKRYCEVIEDSETPTKSGPYICMSRPGFHKGVIRPWRDKMLKLTISPIRNPDGEIYGSVLIAADVTQLKRVETELKNKNKQLKSIFHTVPIIIGVVSDRKVIEANQQLCRLLGYKMEEIIDKNGRLFFCTQKEYLRVVATYEKAKGRQIVPIKTKIKCKDGHAIDVMLHFSPLNTGINGYTFTATEIKKRKESS